MDALYESIRDLRISKGMSQAELAKLTGYTDRSSIAKIEKGEVDLTRTKIIQFAKALGVKAGDLFDGSISLSDIKPIERVDPEDLELLYAFHSAPNSIQDAVLKLLDLGRG